MPASFIGNLAFMSTQQLQWAKKEEAGNIVKI